MQWDDAADLLLKSMMPGMPDNERKHVLLQAQRVHEFVDATIGEEDGGHLRKMTVLKLCSDVAIQQLLWEM